jgi:hypothetical protein
MHSGGINVRKAAGTAINWDWDIVIDNRSSAGVFVVCIEFTCESIKTYLKACDV